ncbi:uncharacterized protein LOC141666733 [Apium graveolens]|uniref:uncharacterized protein LOC141666733 n=1 Tax=Apium graveolens TaxID=4045 RepID=UPI003D79D59A
MASDRGEMTLHDFVSILRSRGISRFQFYSDSQNITNPDQDSSNGSDPPALNQTEMPQITVDENINDSRTESPPITTESTDSQTNTDPDQDSPERSDPRDRIIIMNPLSRRVLVIEGSAWGVNRLVNELISSPDGPPPASKASIEAMPSVETKENDECVICLDEFLGGLAKEMPCKHKFHGECVEKWLKINGSCPVCRYKMPVEDDNDLNHKNVFESEERRRSELWYSVGTFVGDPNQMATNDSDGHGHGHDGHDSEMQGLD